MFVCDSEGVRYLRLTAMLDNGPLQFAIRVLVVVSEPCRATSFLFQVGGQLTGTIDPMPFESFQGSACEYIRAG
jgi:hypothetical protein